MKRDSSFLRQLQEGIKGIATLIMGLRNVKVASAVGLLPSVNT